MRADNPEQALRDLQIQNDAHQDLRHHQSRRRAGCCCGRRRCAWLQFLQTEPALHHSASSARDHRPASEFGSYGRRFRERRFTTTAVLNIANEAGLTALQLHGDESPDYCRELAANDLVIKTLAVSDSFDLGTDLQLTTSTQSCSTRETIVCEVAQAAYLTGQLHNKSASCPEALSRGRPVA